MSQNLASRVVELVCLPKVVTSWTSNIGLEVGASGVSSDALVGEDLLGEGGDTSEGVGDRGRDAIEDAAAEVAHKEGNLEIRDSELVSNKEAANRTAIALVNLLQATEPLGEGLVVELFPELQLNNQQSEKLILLEWNVDQRKLKTFFAGSVSWPETKRRCIASSTPSSTSSTRAWSNGFEG